jgi:methyl-accepting chemotaxis protein
LTHPAFRRLRVVNNISVRQKLFASFGVVLALMVVTGAVAIVQLRSVGAKGDHLYNVNLAATDLSASLRRNGLLMRESILKYVLEPLPEERPKIKAKIGELQQAIDTDIGALKAQQGLTADQRALVVEIDGLMKDWYAKRDKGPIGLTDAGDRAGATEAALRGIGGLAFKAANEAVDKFNETTRLEAKRADDAASSAIRFATMLTILLVLAAVLIAAAIAYLFARGISRAVKELVDAAGRVADGDLTVHIEARSNDELGQLASGVAAMIESLRTTVGSVSQTALELGAASEQMATTSEEAGRAVGEIASAVDDVARGAEKQVHALEQARTMTEEMASVAAASAENARHTAAAAQQARTVSEDGVSTVEFASAAMQAVRDAAEAATETIRALGSKSEQIGGIVATITGIAGQTNLLALNAAIEAARAGEQGRGFAVVAEEVRKLAEESKQAAATISGLIDEIQSETARAVNVVEDGAKRTEEGVSTVDQAREAFVRIGGSVEDVNDRIEQIAAAIEQLAASSRRMQEDMAEVAAVAQQSSASTEEVSASTQQTSASTQEIAASAQELARSADELAQIVSRFTTA